MNRRGIAPLALMALLLAGCGGGSLIQTPVKISPPYEFGDQRPDQSWSRRLESWALDVDLELARDETHLYVAGNQSLSAFSLRKGKLEWETKTGEISGGLKTTEDQVVLSLFNGEVVAIAKQDGSQRWSTFVAGEVLAPAARSGSRLFVQTNNGRLLALNQETGAIDWVVEGTTPALSLRGTSAPLALRGRVFTVDDSCRARMLSSKDGSLIWERILVIPQGSNEIEQLVDADSQPLLLGRDLYVSCYNSLLMQLGAEQGKPGWQVESNSRHDPLSVGTSLILIQEHTASVVAYNLVNGRRLWERTDLAYRQLSNPVQWQGLVLIGDHEGYIHMLRPEDGVIVARFRPFRNRVRTMLAAGDNLYAVDASGTIIAFRSPEG